MSHIWTPGVFQREPDLMRCRHTMATSQRNLDVLDYGRVKDYIAYRVPALTETLLHVVNSPDVGSTNDRVLALLAERRVLSETAIIWIEEQSHTQYAQEVENLRQMWERVLVQQVSRFLGRVADPQVVQYVGAIADLINRLNAPAISFIIPTPKASK